MLTGFLSASAPLPQVLKTLRAGCWSGRNVRRGCLRCPSQYSPLLHRVWEGGGEKKKRYAGWDVVQNKKKNGSNILCILCNPISKTYFEVGEAMRMSPFSICPHDGTVDIVL